MEANSLDFMIISKMIVYSLNCLGYQFPFTSTFIPGFCRISSKNVYSSRPTSFSSLPRAAGSAALAAFCRPKRVLAHPTVLNLSGWDAPCLGLLGKS